MVSVTDVAAFILEKQKPITAMKLQKLCYYAQAWSLAWDEKPLFKEKIEAWSNGPVIAKLYALHRGQYNIESLPEGNPSKLSNAQKETINSAI